MSSQAWINLAYLTASMLFIVAFKQMSGPRTAVRGNLLGAAGMAECLEGLVDALVAEKTKAWVDMARAVGAFGTRALGPLCAALRDAQAAGRVSSATTRVAWALAEIALTGGDATGPAYDAVDALGDAPEPIVARSARRASRQHP